MKALGKVIFASVFVLAGVPMASLGQVSFVQAPEGQSTSVSCQSYALSVALAFRKDPKFTINTAAELRMAEDGIRAEIVKAKGAAAEVSHEHVAAGFKAYTRGQYLLKAQWVDLPALGSLAGSVSGVSSAAGAPPTFLLGATVKDVVLTSVVRVGTSKYASGHIISLMGVDGKADSNRRYLALNGGIKVEGLPAQMACVDGVPDKPSRYAAGVNWLKSSEVDFKDFGGKYLAWTVVKGS